MQVAILGTGQLGDMLKLAGKKIGIDVSLIDIENGNIPTTAMPIAIEREHWPRNELTTALQNESGWLNKEAYPLLVDRAAQKTLLDKLKLKTAKWFTPTQDTSAEELHKSLGPNVFLKRRTGGYDGRGQARINLDQNIPLPDWINESIAEEAISFSAEVSLVAARGHNGHIVYFNLTENLHQNGILYASISPAPNARNLQVQAQNIMKTLMEDLNYIGVMAIEFFVSGNDLLINEIAPRVHNSGHWTQAGASISQFELQLRSMCRLPLVQPLYLPHSVMINLIGIDYNPIWLQDPIVQLHWYMKQLRANRKMGHINIAHHDVNLITQSITQIILPKEYDVVKEWVKNKLYSLQ
jgi:5-(carboxyamino)imidazole ribonucleotide synthase